jgi:tetratricopeptide (TPR) repeat protein
LQSSCEQLVSQIADEERDVDSHLATIVKESLQLPRGSKLPEISATEAQTMNIATWQSVKTPDAFEQAPLTDLQVSQFREVVRQHPREIYYNSLGTAEYRMGNYREAIDAALKSVALSPQVFPGDYAILAMSYSELGEMEPADDYREKFNTTMRLDAFKDDEDCISLGLEVETMFTSILKP